MKIVASNRRRNDILKWHFGAGRHDDAAVADMARRITVMRAFHEAINWLLNFYCENVVA